jgi:hypothetical protein
VTNVILSTPISTLTTGAVVTVTPSQSKRIYQVEASTPITLTNNLTALGANCTTNYEWETWINYTATNALSTVWDSRIRWQQQTPDLTVTGLYKFAMSTACGTIIQARQTYPTVYTHSGLFTYANQGQTQTPVVGASVISAGATNGTFLTRLQEFPSKPVILSFLVYGGNAAPSAITFDHLIYGAGSDQLSVSSATLPTLSGYARVTAYVPACTSVGVATGTSYAMTRCNVTRASTNSVISVYSIIGRPANELETAAYNAGWRP